MNKYVGYRVIKPGLTMFGTNRSNGKRFLRQYPDPAFLESGFFACATDHTKTIDHRELQKIVASFA
jgi:hypothetical protein